MDLDMKFYFVLFAYVLMVNAMDKSCQNSEKFETCIYTEKVLEFSEGRMDTKLQVKPFMIETDIGDDVIQCLGKCLEYSPTCKGINFLGSSSSGEKSVCEILEHYFDDHDTRKKLVCADSWIYYGVSQISVRGVFKVYSV